MSFRLNSRASHAVGLNNLRSLLPKWGVYLGYALVLASFFCVSIVRADALQDEIRGLELATIKQDARWILRDAATNRYRFSDTMMDAIINQGQKDINALVMPIHESTTISLSQNTTYYALPIDLLVIDRVTFQNKNLPEQTLAALDSSANFSAWEQTGGQPTAYFQDPAQTGFIGVFPYPNSTSAVGTLKIIYSAQAAPMVNPTDTPFNGDIRCYPYNDLLTYYVIYNCLYADGDLDRAREFRSIYEVRLKSMMDAIGARPNYKPGFSGPTPR